MKERIEQLLDEGLDEAGAVAIAGGELERARKLLAEGFAQDRVIARAQAEVKLERLVREKRAAGLTVEQAQSVANEQIANDARVLAEGLKSKNSGARSEAQAMAKRNAAVAAEMLAELAPAQTEEAKA